MRLQCICCLAIFAKSGCQCQQATRNFASEAQQLSKKLEEKEQEVRLTNVERVRIQKHLQNLERLILRSVKPTVSFWGGLQSCPKTSDSISPP